jgi:hypothetical protein
MAASNSSRPQKDDGAGNPFDTLVGATPVKRSEISKFIRYVQDNEGGFVDWACAEIDMLTGVTAHFAGKHSVYLPLIAHYVRGYADMNCAIPWPLKETLDKHLRRAASLRPGEAVAYMEKQGALLQSTASWAADRTQRRVRSHVDPEETATRKRHLDMAVYTVSKLVGLHNSYATGISGYVGQTLDAFATEGYKDTSGLDDRSGVIQDFRNGFTHLLNNDFHDAVTKFDLAVEVTLTEDYDFPDSDGLGRNWSGIFYGGMEARNALVVALTAALA